jgi:hypothetical protein
MVPCISAQHGPLVGRKQGLVAARQRQARHYHEIRHAGRPIRTAHIEVSAHKLPQGTLAHAVCVCVCKNAYFSLSSNYMRPHTYTNASRFSVSVSISLSLLPALQSGIWCAPTRSLSLSLCNASVNVWWRTRQPGALPPPRRPAQRARLRLLLEASPGPRPCSVGAASRCRPHPPVPLAEMPVAPCAPAASPAKLAPAVARGP